MYKQATLFLTYDNMMCMITRKHRELINVHILAIRKVVELQDEIDALRDSIALKNQYIEQLEEKTGGFEM